MKTVARLFCLWLAVVAPQAAMPAAPGRGVFRQPDAKAFPDLFVWTDTCNVYVLREGDAALLIDLGDGVVLEHLAELGVTRVEWVLFTHHHREQCQGAPRLKGSGAKVAAPETERALFERPAEFRKLKVSLGDPFTIHGSSYVRPPIQPIPLDRTFRTNETFAWRGREFLCLDTRGNSPGGMSYLLERGGRRLAFSGDVMLDGARMHTWFDTALDGMREHFGLKAIDAVVITHMHGDHFLQAPHLREKWGAPIWALDNMVDKREHPDRFDYAAPIQAYGKKNADGSALEGARVDRAFKPGETFAWEGYRFTVDWMPGQTEFALCLQGVIDGRKVAFTGDNIFGDPDDPAQTGHEAMVAFDVTLDGRRYGEWFDMVVGEPP